MKARRRLAIVAATLALLGAGAGAAYWLQAGDDADPAAFQGYVEGNLVHAAPEEGGRIERLLVDSGNPVAVGQVLFALDATMQTAQRDEAQAKLRQAEAQLANLRAAVQRPEQIAVLWAQEERARAQLDLSKEELERQKALYERGIAAKARLDQAEATYERDKAARDEVLRQIRAGQVAGRSAEIEAAEAAVRAAEAALRQAETRLAKRQVVAPADARVQDVFFRAGEVVTAGQPVLALLPPANLRFRFYAPEPVLSTLSLGQTVVIACDSCPEGQRARITFISREAEYTPPVIFSERERAKLVFRVEAEPVGAVRLPIGLPVSVRPILTVVASPGGPRS
jgi:HlyD family secretion protein